MLDPNHPNVKRGAQVISDIVWQYLQTHTPEEIAELQARVERDRQLRHQMFGSPAPIESRESA